jgi:hypothetical protein
MPNLEGADEYVMLRQVAQSSGLSTACAAVPHVLI